MKTRYSFLAATALTAICGPTLAQVPPGAGIVYQQAGVMSSQSGPGRGRITATIFDLAGSPLSATQQSHSLQVLGDGTRIETSESHQFYRDSMGRTRVESGPPGSGKVMIQDPVGKFAIVLDPTTKTAQKTNRNGQVAAALDLDLRLSLSMNTGTGVLVAQAGVPGGAAVSSSKPVVEDFPVRNVNGVLATGHRTTLTIPAGEIGNDRPIQVVSETWYSDDLQMMVKSSNSDPRFGDTSFELTNISRSEPDSSLFQIPADYAVSEVRPAQLRTVQPPPTKE
jgi:hypothetical protein